MVVRATEGRGIGHHDRRVAIAPERGVVGAVDVRYQRLRYGNALGGKLGVRSEAGDSTSHQIARGEVSDEGEKRAGIRIEPAYRRGIALAARFIAVVADALKRDHPNDAITARTYGSGIDPTTHALGVLKRFLFVGKGYEPEGTVQSLSVVFPGELKARGETRCIVVS